MQFVLRLHLAHARISAPYSRIPPPTRVPHHRIRVHQLAKYARTSTQSRAFQPKMAMFQPRKRVSQPPNSRFFTPKCANLHTAFAHLQQLCAPIRAYLT
eukprot:3423717-Rhodomonas_salina.2